MSLMVIRSFGIFVVTGSAATQNTATHRPERRFLAVVLGIIWLTICEFNVVLSTWIYNFQRFCSFVFLLSYLCNLRFGTLPNRYQASHTWRQCTRFDGSPRITHAAALQISTGVNPLPADFHLHRNKLHPSCQRLWYTHVNPHPGVPAVL